MSESQPNQVVDSESALPATGDWYVLHTRSRQEKILAADLGAMNIGYYLPLVRQTRTLGSRNQTVNLPMFPGYLFLRGTREQAFAADRTKRVANIIAVPDQQHIEWELENLHLALANDVTLDPFPYLEKGVRVEVRGGPMRGLQGVVESRKSMHRLVLQIDMLGRAMSMEIDAALLDPI